MPRLNVFVWCVLVFATILLTAGCSEDSKPTAPNPTWRWAKVGTADYITGASITTYNGELIVAGRGVYAWNGSSWKTLLSGTGGIIVQTAVYDNKLIVAGQFNYLVSDSLGTLNYHNIAAWDGSSWTSLGTGVNYDVRGLTVWNNMLVASGNFDTAGGVSALHIAAWDGSTWHAFASGWNETVTNLIVYNTQLVAGTGSKLRVWDGVLWNALPDFTEISQNGSTSALAIYDGKLIRGGGFMYNQTEQMYIAAWDGSAWTTLGAGTNYWVYGLTVFDNKLIAAGGFTTAGGDTVNRIASWDGSAWTPLGTGMDNSVMAVGVFNDKLVACGNFTNAGGVDVPNLAAWGLQ